MVAELMVWRCWSLRGAAGWLAKGRGTGLRGVRGGLQRGFYIGCHPEMDAEVLEYVLSCFEEFFAGLGGGELSEGER